MPNQYVRVVSQLAFIILISIFISSCGKSMNEIAQIECECLSSIEESMLFTIEELSKHIDSCSTFIEKEYKISESSEAENFYVEYESPKMECISDLEYLYQSQVDTVAKAILNNISLIYNQNYYIDKEVYSNLESIVKENTQKSFGSSIPEEIYEESIFTDPVVFAFAEFKKRFEMQPTKPFFAGDFIIHQSDINSYNTKYGNANQINKGDRVLFIFFIAPEYEETSIFSVSNSNFWEYGLRWTSDLHKDYLIKPSFYNDNYNTKRIEGYALGKDSAQKIIYKHLGNYDYQEEYFKDVSSDPSIRLANHFSIKTFGYNVLDQSALKGNEGKIVLMSGDFKGVDLDVAKNGYETKLLWKAVFFDSCEVIKVYEISNGVIDRPEQMWNEYMETLKNNPPKMDVTVIYSMFNSIDTPSNHETNGNVSSNSCQEFLDGYEKYMFDYLQVVDDYSKNQDDLELMQKAINMASESSKWTEKLDESCTQDPKFLSRYTEIQLKLAKAAEKLY